MADSENPNRVQLDYIDPATDFEAKDQRDARKTFAMGASWCLVASSCPCAGLIGTSASSFAEARWTFYPLFAVAAFLIVSGIVASRSEQYAKHGRALLGGVVFGLGVALVIGVIVWLFAA